MIIGGLAAGAVALAALSLTTAALIASPAAQAFTDGTPASHYGGGHLGDQDGSAYVIQLNILGSGYSPEQATNLGQTLCRDLAFGETEAQIVERGVTKQISFTVARAVLHGAEFHFCPNYFGGKEV
jgi:hypothetical protein